MFGMDNSGMSKIAILNTSEDVIEAMTIALEGEGYEIVSALIVDFKKGRSDVGKFFEREKPDLVVYDLAPPLDENWAFYKKVSRSDAAKGVPFILTTTNRIAVREAVGNEDIDVMEIVLKPFELKQLVKKVESALNE